MGKLKCISYILTLFVYYFYWFLHAGIFAGGNQVIHFTPEINSKTAKASRICSSSSSICSSFSPSSCPNFPTIPRCGIGMVSTLVFDLMWLRWKLRSCSPSKWCFKDSWVQLMWSKMIYRKAGKEKIACFVSTFRLKFWTKIRNWNGANQGWYYNILCRKKRLIIQFQKEFECF